ncbi:phage tail tip protein J-related protein, partial [Vibrio furnissii]|uniref:phage tail tip protein J-related protein n=1 Tax=Vibrio furnissii TaxID=29494 RepID=UPI001EEB3345
MWGLVAAIVLSIASVAYTMVTSRKMQTREDSERAGIQVTRFGIDQAIPVVRGTRKVKPIVVYEGTKDIDGDPSNEVLYVAMVWAIGPVSRLSDFQFDDLPYSNFGSFGTGTSQRVEHLLGSDDQTLPSWFHEAPDDMTGMDFSGLAVTFVKLVMDDEFKRYPQGRPDFSAVITAGSSNPVDTLEDFLTNSDWGMGFPIADLDLLHNDLMRSYCNNVVDGHNLMTCNVVLDTEDDLQSNLDIILQTCRGYLVEGQNGLRLEIDRQRDAVLHVSESMLTGGLKTASVNINDRYNSVTIRFPDRDLNWENNEVTFPEKESPLSLQWLEEDNQVPLTHEETVDGIDTYEHALQLAEVLARTSRTGMTLDMSVKAWIGCQVEEMDVVTVESQLRGWEAKPFAVREIEYRENETRLKLVEYQDSNYLWRSKPAKPDYPDTLKRNPLEVAAPGDLSFLDSDQPNVAGRLSWTGPGGYVAGYDVRVMAGNLVVWQQHAKTNQLAIPLFLSGEYQFLVRTVGALAVSSWSVLAVDLVAPDAPFEVQTDTGNTYIILRPQSDSLAFGTEYEFWFNDELRGTGVAWQIEGLQPDTEYAFQVRAVNAVGQSEFVPVTATTTKDASVVLDILSGQLTRDILDANLNAYFDGIDESLSLMATKIETTETNLSTVTEDVQGIKNELVNFDRDVEDASRSAFETAVAMQGYMAEYDRRLLEQETLTDATVYRDPETGQIINRAYQYTDARYSEATIRMDGLASDILLSTQEIERVEAATGNRITQAEAAIQLQNSVISQKASFSDVTEAISGAMAAITPAYSWQFNTSAEGWPNVSWQQDGTIIGTVFERSDLSFDASENTAIRLRVKSDTGGTLSWNGGSQAVAIPSPSGATEFETIILTLSDEDGWSGTINAIRIEMDAEIASFEIGKPSASELQMQELSYRITQAEQELDAENARWSTYITQDYWDTNALKQSDVSNTLDAWNTTYQVTAQLKVLSDNDTVQKANQAKSWVDGANATITDLVVAYNTKPGGTDDQLQQQSEQLQAAQQDIDALQGEISQTVFSITELGNRQGDRDKGYNALLDSFNHFRQTGEIETEKVALSYAQQRITANTDRLESHAQSLLQLIAVQGEHQSSLTRLDQATATNERAIAQTNSTLTAKLNAESQARSEAISQVESTAQQARATLQETLESQLSEESQARSEAISQVESNAQKARATLQQNLESQLSEESQARNTAIS